MVFTPVDVQTHTGADKRGAANGLSEADGLGALVGTFSVLLRRAAAKSSAPITVLIRYGRGFVVNRPQ